MLKQIFKWSKKVFSTLTVVANHSLLLYKLGLSNMLFIRLGYSSKLIVVSAITGTDINETISKTIIKRYIISPPQNIITEGGYKCK